VRTTLSIEDDVAALLEQEVRRSGDSLKGTVNRLLRLGLMAADKPPARKRFVIRARDFTFPPGVNTEKTEDMLEALEGPLHK
jgi:hypothetical protein